jgi:hypothetical protein
MLENKQVWTYGNRGSILLASLFFFSFGGIGV